MSVINFILNLAALLLWISWRNLPFDPINRLRPATLTGTLRPAEPTHVKRWHFLAGLLALLSLRPLLYTWIGSALGWVPSVDLGAVALSFRSDLFWPRMVPYSFASFAHVLVVFYAWLILFSFSTPRGAEPGPGHRWVRLQLGKLASLPAWLRALLPLLVMGLGWLASCPAFEAMGIVPAARDWSHRAQQAAVIGVGSYLFWKYALVAVLALHLLDTYVYLGSSPLWNFVNATGRWLLQPLRVLPLRLGRMDFAPLAGIVVVFLIAMLMEGDGEKWGLSVLFRKLPFF
jgi:uncharacterized protein YggT (Ycf19 family)